MKKKKIKNFDYEVYYSNRFHCYALYDYFLDQNVCHFWDLKTLKNIIKTHNIDSNKIYYNINFINFLKLNFR